MRARSLIALLEGLRLAGPGQNSSSASHSMALPSLRSVLGAPASSSAAASSLESSASTKLLAARAARGAWWRGQLHTSAASTGSALPPRPSTLASGSSQQGLHTTAVSNSMPSHAAAEFSSSAKQVLYKGRGMQLFRVLVRMKVFQLAGVAALAVPINTFLATGDVSSTQMVMASALVVGAGVASTALWYYSRRYVGELALLPGQAGQPPRVRLSVLDFWGNREDNDVPLQALVPPLQKLPDAARRAALQEPLLPVDVEGDRQYFLSVRYGHIVDAATLKALLSGQLEGQRLRGDEDS